MKDGPVVEVQQKLVPGGGLTVGIFRAALVMNVRHLE